jgi:ribonucleotide reductase alpha subunit
MSFNSFCLSKNFVEKYRKISPDFGFGVLGELVYRRTYSRLKEDGINEEWFETIERVVNGTYNMQKKWVEQHSLGWNAWQAQKSAQEMYDRMFNMKFLPPGRGLWAMGSALTEEKELFMCLNNCSFVSTINLKEDYAKPFLFMMDASMLGVGVGFDTKGAGTIIIKNPNENRKQEVFIIPDSREGWVESLRLLLECYFHGTASIEFDYSQVREAGILIKGFGGTSSGSEPLKLLHINIRKVLNRIIGQPISITAITDIMNLIGVCVVSGNVRRTAQIVFGDYDNEEYIDLKNYKKNPEREEFGWTSNNSIFAEIGMNYKDVADRIMTNGEPGYIWLDNIKKFSRMNNQEDNKDHRAEGANPCVEQSLESWEICNLVETFPTRHKTLEDYQRTLKFAYLYAKTVTLGKTHWPETNRVMLRNRRIGCSMSGIAQFISMHGINILKNWCEEGFKVIEKWDDIYSDWLAIPKSIKRTSIKPSGSISLVAGATPGIHHPESRFYIRRMRLSKYSDLVEPLKKANYVVEPANEDVENTVVVEIPVDVGEGVRTVKELTMWEQATLAAFMQKYWADNQVSCTITFNPKTEGEQIKHLLDCFQYQLKGISFLPRKEKGVYKQMPYETIDELTYNSLVNKLKPIKFEKIKNELVEVEKFCSNDSCEIKIVKK